MIPAEQLQKLRAIAEGATPKWQTGYWRGVLEWPVGEHMSLMAHGPIHKEDDEGLHLVVLDGEHIAAFDPPTCLGLLAEIERLREALEKIAFGNNPEEQRFPGGREYYYRHNACAALKGES